MCPTWLCPIGLLFPQLLLWFKDRYPSWFSLLLASQVFGQLAFGGFLLLSVSGEAAQWFIAMLLLWPLFHLGLYFWARVPIGSTLVVAIVVLGQLAVAFGVGMGLAEGNTSFQQKVAVATLVAMYPVVFCLSFLSQKLLWKFEKLDISIATFCALTASPGITLIFISSKFFYSMK